MTDHNSPEAVAARANQEDPIVMYLIVRESLNMSVGKTAAQCAHASQMLLLKQFDFILLDMSSDNRLPPFSRETFELFQEWLDGSFRKVVLKADDKEWVKIKDQIRESNRVTVVDAGLTEVEPGSETVIGLVPMRKSNVPRVIKRLQVLK
jgi:PTH2 family peptidyl-tRNA hydrolase